MKFFEAQKLARQNSFKLGILFCVNVVVLSALNSFFVVFFLSPGPHSFVIHDLHIQIFIASAILFVGAAAFFLATAPSGHTLAESMGGRWLQSPSTDEEKRLQNVVEEMAIASGVPLPRIYILDGEEGINAFAAGTEPFTMAIAVTKGTLQLLDRDELQGVIGHEFSHVLNEDMKLNMRLAAVVMAFIIFVRLGEAFMRGSRRSRFSKKSQQGAPIGFVLYAFGSIGYFLGRIIQGMISQQREFLADASSAQFTRNPESLARALAKINLGAGSVVRGTSRHEFAHIFFSEGVAGAWTSFVKTHPPLSDRIQRLVPRQSLDRFVEGVQLKMQGSAHFQEHAAKKVERLVLGNSVLEMIGAPTAAHLALSQQMVGRLAPVRGYLRLPSVARASLALVAFRSQAQYQDAKELLRSDFKTPGAFEQVSQIVDDADSTLRVVLFHFVLETLRELPVNEKQSLLDQMTKVFALDQRLSLLEALMFINAQLILMPGRKSLRSLQNKPESELSEILLNPEKVELERLESSIYSICRRSLLEKRKFVEEMLWLFRNMPERSEEFRLLCLAVKVPVPIL